MDDKIASFSPKIYTDIQGLKQLEHSKDTKGAKKEVAQQFESILMQMVLGSMRQANKVFASGLFGSDAMDIYQDIFDKQLSLMMSNENLGFASMVEKSIDQMQPGGVNTTAIHGTTTASVPSNQNENSSQEVSKHVEVKPFVVKNETTKDKETFATPEDFVKKLWGAAKFAAQFIGASPEILLAQAAMETNWGKNIIADAKNVSTHNLFNIKAGSSWPDKKTVVAETLEQKQDVLIKEKAHFRQYDSFNESFLDYVNLLKTHERYSKTVDSANKPEEFASALQDAGYATDKNYANKIMKVYNSQSFQNLVTKAKSDV